MNVGEWQALELSFQVAGLSTLFNLLPAILVACWLSRPQLWGKWLWDGLIHLPLVLPPVTVGYLLLLVFGQNGCLGSFLKSMGWQLSFSFAGAVLASTIVSFPLVVRSIRVGLDSRDRGLEAAASTLGAAPWQVFLSITLPLAWPGIISGALLGFARSLGEFGATITFAGNLQGQTQTLPLAIYSQMQIPGGESGANRLVWISIVLSLVAMAASEFCSRWVQRHQGVQGRDREAAS